MIHLEVGIESALDHFEFGMLGVKPCSVFKLKMTPWQHRPYQLSQGDGNGGLSFLCLLALGKNHLSL